MLSKLQTVFKKQISKIGIFEKKCLNALIQNFLLGLIEPKDPIVFINIRKEMYDNFQGNVTTRIARSSIIEMKIERTYEIFEFLKKVENSQLDSENRDLDIELNTIFPGERFSSQKIKENLKKNIAPEEPSITKVN